MKITVTAGDGGADASDFAKSLIKMIEKSTGVRADGGTFSRL